MKKNNKGFTLIELLAVIIILAIIALIAVPTIMDIINKSKEKAALDAAYGVASAAELWYTNQLLENNGAGLKAKATFTCDVSGCTGKIGSGEAAENADPLSIKGDIPIDGKIEIFETGEIKTTAPLKFSVSSKTFNINDGEVEEVTTS